MKIKTGLKIVVAALMAIIAIGMWTSIFTGKHARELAGKERVEGAIIEKITGLRTLTYDYLMYRTDRAKKQWWLTYDDVDRLLAASKSQASWRHDSFNDLIARHARVRDIFKHLLENSEKRDSDPEKDAIYKEVENRLTAQLLVETQLMVSDVFQLHSELGETSRAALRRADLIHMGTLAMAFIILVISSLYVFRSVVKPIFKLHEGVGIVAAGNLEHETGVEVRNEVGDLSRSFDEMTSNLKQYTLQLERSNRELEDFAFITSHDLQEPLRKIQIFADRLKNTAVNPAGATERDYLERIQRSAERMQELILALLRYSRINKSTEPFTLVNLKEAAHGAVMDLNLPGEETAGLVRIGDLPSIEADPAQMRQLFHNLIGNALKYHGKDTPVVEVYCNSMCPDGCLEICVKDNGIGFDERFLDKIFKPFQRLHGKDSQYPGTGMGLAICRRIVERHGGNIGARSEPGMGAEFILRLPENCINRHSK